MTSGFRIIAFMVGLTAGLAAPAAHADPLTLDQCVTASESGQVARDSGKYVQAMSDFRTCTQPECPAIVQHDCHRWLAELDARMPTVILAATRGGRPISEASVELDGALLQSRLTGTPVSIDPGAHALVVRLNDQVVEQQVFVIAGDKNRVITVDFPAREEGHANARQDERGERPFPWAPAGLAALSGLAFGAFAYVGLSARGDLSDLKATPCAVTLTCPPSRMDSIKTRFFVADVLLATGVVALGAATWLWLRRDTSTTPRTSTVWIAPSVDGFQLGWSKHL